MAVVTIPSTGIAGIEWTRPRPLLWGVRSAWTRKRVVYDSGATDPWRAVVTVAPRTIAEAMAWSGFFAECVGPLNSFDLPIYPSARHTGSNGAVRSGTQTPVSVPLKGLPTSRTPLIPKGSALTFVLPSGARQAVELIADLNTDGSGNATAQFRPPLRQSPSVDAVVTTATPFVRMSLTGEPTGWNEERALLTPFSFACEEVW